MKLHDAPAENRPEWLHPAPNWSAAMSGVLYHGMPTDALLDYLAQSRIVSVWGSVGRCLYERSLGPRMAYSVDRLDRSRGCRVKDRPWPWCHGDELVFLVQGPAGVTILDIEIDAPSNGRWYSEVGTSPEGSSCYAFMRKAEAWVEYIIGPRARLLDAQELQRQASELLLPDPTIPVTTKVSPSSQA